MSSAKRIMNFKGLTLNIPKEINAMAASNSGSTPTSNGPLTIIEKKKENAAYYTTSNFQSNEHLVKNNINSRINK
jgi:hypothetical protein